MFPIIITHHTKDSFEKKFMFFFISQELVELDLVKHVAVAQEIGQSPKRFRPDKACPFFTFMTPIRVHNAFFFCFSIIGEIFWPTY